jgi:hypothetical protein
MQTIEYISPDIAQCYKVKVQIRSLNIKIIDAYYQLEYNNQTFISSICENSMWKDVSVLNLTNSAATISFHCNKNIIGIILINISYYAQENYDNANYYWFELHSIGLQCEMKIGLVEIQTNKDISYDETETILVKNTKKLKF